MLSKHQGFEEIRDMEPSYEEDYEFEERTDEWRIEQFNRKRGIEDQVKTIEQLKEVTKKLFNEEK